jgi:hypothetical protein
VKVPTLASAYRATFATLRGPPEIALVVNPARLRDPPDAPLPLSIGAHIRVAEGLLAGRQGTVTHLKTNSAHLSLDAIALW